MKCMKCGRRIDADRVFCEECLVDMEKYPVPPETPVILPSQGGSAPRRPVIHPKVRKPEERIATLKTWVMFLSILVIGLLLAVFLSMQMLFSVMEQNNQSSSAGQNYETGPSSTDTGH